MSNDQSREWLEGYNEQRWLGRTTKFSPAYQAGADAAKPLPWLENQNNLDASNIEKLKNSPNKNNQKVDCKELRNFDPSPKMRIIFLLSVMIFLLFILVSVSI